MAVDTQEIKGFDDLAAKLRQIPDVMRKRVLRNALAAGARLVRDSAKADAPVLQGSAPYRTPGTVKNAISVRTSKAARKLGDVGVFVNVRPAKGAIYRSGKLVRTSQRGAKSKTDPYYWRFLEFGTTRMDARPFLKPAAGRLPAALAVFQTQLGKWVAKVNAAGKVQP